jgi:proteasome accessory factor C
MDRLQRWYCLDRLLKARRLPVKRADIEHEMEASVSTVKRTILEMRNFGAPIEYDRERNGYCYDPAAAFELPGIWFTPGEVTALITAHDLLASAEPGLLKEALAPLRSKLDKLLKLEHLGSGELPKRVRIIRIGGRRPGLCFAEVAQALVERKQLRFDYRARTTGDSSTRKVSPQRLVHYRDNWYLDAWCHERKGLRMFALELVMNAKVADKTAKEIGDKALREHFAASYGIFAGKPIGIARLVFSAHRAQWVAAEHWHHEQVGALLPDGRYQLEIPYSNTRELVMDILKNGADVEVISPPALVDEVRSALRATLEKYTNARKAAPDKELGGVRE